MAKYRISVEEVLEDGTTQPFTANENGSNKLEGDGFVLIALSGVFDGICQMDSSIHNVSINDIAAAFLNNEHLRMAASLAAALNAEEVESIAPD